MMECNLPKLDHRVTYKIPNGYVLKVNLKYCPLCLDLHGEAHLESVIEEIIAPTAPVPADLAEPAVVEPPCAKPAP